MTLTLKQLESRSRLDKLINKCRICLEKPRKGVYGTFSEDLCVNEFLEGIFFDLTQTKVSL